MNISSIYLQAFYQLAQARNFTQAASELGITQSAFSHRVMNLERELEMTLFIREKGNVQLTDGGEKLLRYCEKINRLETELLGAVKKGGSQKLSGVIRIGGFSSVLRSCVIPALGSLLRENPDLGVEMSSVELSELEELLRISKVDFVLSNKDPQKNSVEASFLGFEENVLVESKKYDFNRCYLDHDSKDVTTSSYFKLKPELNKDIRKRYLDDVYGLIDGVKAGLGRAILPSHLIEDEKDLKILYPRTKLRVPVYLLYYKNSFYTELEKMVTGEIQGYFRGRFSQE